MTLLPGAQQERAELKLVLSSTTFSKSPNLGRLLQFLCSKYFEGKLEELKEYNIGVEALGRPPDFDPTTNSIVRVELHRLREKLNKYFETEGNNDPVIIRLQSGSHIPQFLLRGNHEAGSPELRDSRLPAAGTDDRAVLSEVGGSTALPQEAISDKGSEAKKRWGWVGARGARWAVMASVLILILVLGLAAAALLREWRVRNGLTTTSMASTASHEGAVPFARGSGEVRILAGYTREGHIDRAGNFWLGDRYYSGGVASSQPPQFLARAPDMTLYQTFRSGNFSYHIPLKPGNYELHLYFAETHYGPGSLSGGGEASRLFDVLLNGKPLLRIFDIIKDAGGNNIGDERVFKDVTPAADGFLHLTFQALIDSPILNAIEIEPAPAGKINPIRIVAQNNSYTDHAGNIWSPDRYYSGGQLAVHITAKPVSRTSDPSLYSAERYGHFSYAIPVAPGKYRVTLRFAETYWGVENRIPSLPDQNGSLGGGAGSRVFDVYCNGVALLRNFDIFNAAGGPFIAVEKTFDNLEPNAEGKLMLAFVPVKDYASVTALEVVSEPH